MTDVYNETREWLLAQPVWLQVAAERILKSGELDQTDLQAVCAMLKEPNLEVAQQRDFDGLSEPSSEGSELRLMSISEVCGIENLSSERSLNFGSGNLTVIYGHNGSGKSSYTRILKKASGKPRSSELKSNVFCEEPAERKCRITFYRDQEHPVDWPANGSPIDAIRAMDIFDSDVATHYLDRESVASYVPPVVALLQALAEACKGVQALLKDELGRLVSAKPIIPAIYAVTRSARRYGMLADLNDDEVDQFLTWTTKQDSELDTLVQRLSTANHAEKAQSLRKKKAQVDLIISSLRQAVSAYSSDKLKALQILRDAATEKRKIASEAVNIESAEIDKVGVPTWHELWEAARAFSQIAYPGRNFPVTDARCVLCHQELTEDAPQRLRDFESFVQGRLEADAKAAEEALQQALSALPGAPTRQYVETQCEAAGLPEGWSEHLGSFWTSVSDVRAELVAGIWKVKTVGETDEALGRLQSYSDRFESDAIQSEKDALEFDRDKALSDKLELEAQRWVSEQAASIRKEVERCRRVQAYEDWKAESNPLKISNRAGKVAEQVITPAYVRRFNDELKKLGAMRINIELSKTRTEVGKVFYQLKLKGAKDRKSTPGNVLSEGERRIISLAAFLADVADKSQIAPFIFDDPISSLDQDFESSVASRLLELAKHRQVIVFTHRLSLFGAMEDAAEKMGKKWAAKHYQPICIESYAGIAGNPVPRETWNSPTGHADEHLLARIKLAKEAGDSQGGSEYRNLAQGICIDFRILLERTVEDDLFQKVVSRHKRSVNLDHRLKAIPVITPADCDFLDVLMDRFSPFAHSQSQEAPAIIPEEPVLRADIEALKKWRQDFKQRRATYIKEVVHPEN